MSERTASIEITATSRGLAARLREARSKFTAFADGVRGEMNKKLGLDKGGGIGPKLVATTLGNLSSSAISRAAGFIEDIGESTFKFDDKLTRLQITAEATPGAMKSYADSIRVASDATGIARSDILDAGYAFVALTGDMNTARNSTGTWAKVAQATGSDIRDIASAAAALSQQMGIKPEQMEETFGALAIQGKKGAVELKDIAGGMQKVAPLWAMFSRGSGIEGVRELGSALQIAKRGFGGDAMETIDGIQGMLVAFEKNSKRFEQGGVRMFDVDKDGTKHMRNVLDIVDDIGRSKLVADPTAMEKAFGRVEGYRAYIQLEKNRQEFTKLVDESRDAEVIQRDLATYLASTGGKVAMGWQEAKNQIADLFTPERIEMFASGLVKVVSLVAKIAEEVAGVASMIGTIGDFASGYMFSKSGSKEEDDYLNQNGLFRNRFADEISMSDPEYRKFREGLGGWNAAIPSLGEIGVNDPYAIATREAGFKGTQEEFYAQRNFNTARQGFGRALPGALAGLARDNIPGLNALPADAAAAVRESGRVIAQVIREGLKQHQTNVQIGADSVAKASAEAPTHRAKGVH